MTTIALFFYVGLPLSIIAGYLRRIALCLERNEKKGGE
jgi:hypothetical protein